ncbi:unnamed protein product [Adineta ricciae]|uniref:Galectin n=1 Tax=Adineta ricciae TaxID=249248 RepID=A0A815WQF4_ADIRI|nr:unnamed protein product [Adineta ricciae]
MWISGWPGQCRRMDDGQTFETIKRLTFNCAVGRNSYSTGNHRIRIKLHYGSAFVGIRSRHIQVEPNLNKMYCGTPSTYGWYTHGRRFVDGQWDGERIHISNADGAVIELTLHCNEHRLSIVICKDSSERDEIEVNDLHCPFPWCLFVQINRIGARLSLV